MLSWLVIDLTTPWFGHRPYDTVRMQQLAVQIYSGNGSQFSRKYRQKLHERLKLSTGAPLIRMISVARTGYRDRTHTSLIHPYRSCTRLIPELKLSRSGHKKSHALVRHTTMLQRNTKEKKWPGMRILIAMEAANIRELHRSDDACLFYYFRFQSLRSIHSVTVVCCNRRNLLINK